jgi:hypothetical protein
MIYSGQNIIIIYFENLYIVDDKIFGQKGVILYFQKLYHIGKSNTLDFPGYYILRPGCIQGT